MIGLKSMSLFSTPKINTALPSVPQTLIDDGSLVVRSGVRDIPELGAEVRGLPMSPIGRSRSALTGGVFRLGINALMFAAGLLLAGCFPQTYYVPTLGTKKVHAEGAHKSMCPTSYSASSDVFCGVSRCVWAAWKAPADLRGRMIGSVIEQLKQEAIKDAANKYMRVADHGGKRFRLNHGRIYYFRGVEIERCSKEELRIVVRIKKNDLMKLITLY